MKLISVSSFKFVGSDIHVLKKNCIFCGCVNTWIPCYNRKYLLNS